MTVGRHPLEQVERLGDLVEVPPRAVLVGQQHEPPGGVDARVPAGVLEEQQREQGLQHRLVGAQGEGDPHEPHGLPRQVGAQQVGAAARGVAGGEREVGDLRDDAQPLGQRRGVGHPERDAGRHDLALAAGEPGGHRRLGHEEEPGDVGGRHADDEPQGQRTGHVGRQGRVAAHQHQAQHVVVDRVDPLDEVARVGAGRPERGGGLGVDHEQRLLARRHRLGPQPVEHPPAGGGHQPGRPGRSGMPSRGQVRAPASTASARASSNLRARIA